MAFCTQCGSRLGADFKFCADCGSHELQRRVKAEEATGVKGRFWPHWARTPHVSPLNEIGGLDELLGVWISDLGLGLGFWTLDKKSGPWIRISGAWIRISGTLDK